jgi:two-component system response regulator HydG
VATNDELHEVVKESNFREDLYHRINEFKIKLPPLRERKEDILLFSKHFIEQANKELNKNIQDLDPKTREAFLKYPWYGNLREMRNVIKRSVLLASGEFITADTLPEEIRNQDAHAGLSEGVHVSGNPDTLNLKDAAIQAEKEIILNALQKSNYNKSRAAKILNIDRKTLYNKIKQFQIQLEH